MSAGRSAPSGITAAEPQPAAQAGAPGRVAQPGAPGRAALLLVATTLLVTALLATVLPAVRAQASDGPRTAQMDTRPLIVETDLGADDVMALAWLVNEPTVDIQAITVSGTGLAHCTQGVANLRALLVALDATGPEIGCGSETPIGGGRAFPEASRAAADDLHGLALPAAPDAALPTRSAEAIIEGVLDAALDPVSILALGPMTTLARVVADPERAVRIASVTASLGALETSGDVIPDGATAPGRAEWNAHADPLAVSAVLESGVPLQLITLDATDGLAMSATLRQALSAGGDDPSAALIAGLLDVDPSIADPAFFPRDALAVAALVAPELMETRGRMVRVIADGPDAGALVEDEAGLPAVVTISVDRSAFELALLSGLRGADAAPLATPAGVLTITGGVASCSLDAGGTTRPGLAIVRAQALDASLVAVLAGLAEGHGVADLEAFLATAGPAQDPPDWLLISAYLEVDAGSTIEDTAELSPGTYVAICITGDAATPSYLVAPTVLTIGA
jgi:pyrimidine-specific ribonucleoside hydrolase